MSVAAFKPKAPLPSDRLPTSLPDRAFWDGVLTVLDNHEARIQQAEELVAVVSWVKKFLKYMTPLMIAALAANVDPDSPLGRMLAGVLSFLTGQ